MRGCFFSEDFQSPAAVIKNGGVVTGTPLKNRAKFTGDLASYIVYTPDVVKSNTDGKTQMSIIISDVTVPLNIANTGYIVSNAGTTGWGLDWWGNSGLRFKNNVTGWENQVPFSATLYAGMKIKSLAVVFDGTLSGNANIQKIYFDGVQQTIQFAGAIGTTIAVSNGAFNLGSRNSGSPLPNNSSFGRIKIFNTALTAQEVLDYADDACFNYKKKAIIDLPMDMAHHDPTNLLMKDASGNNNNAVYSNTGLTKLAQKGYTFTANNSVSVPDCAMLNPANISLEAWIKISNTLSGYGVVFLKTTTINWTDGFGLTGVGISPPSRLGFWINSYNINYTTYDLDIGVLYHVVGTYDGANKRLYVNGVQVASAAYSTPISHPATTPLTIGNGLGGVVFNGDIKGAKMYNFALTPLQVMDSYQKGLKELNLT